MTDATTNAEKTNLDDVIRNLDLSLVEAEDEETDDDVGEEGDNSEGSSSDEATHSHTPSGERTDEGEKKTAEIATNNELSKTPSTQSSKKSDKMNLLKRLISGSSTKQPEVNKSYKMTKEELAQIKVDRLPQRFVVKYLGNRVCVGLHGIKVTREPVDQMVAELRTLDKVNDDLPLVDLQVTLTGVDASLHRSNASRRPLSSVGHHPLEFISYAVQDTRYARVCAMVFVREMSSRTRSTECHAFLCDTVTTARQVALSVSLAFKMYEKRLDGKPHRFQVDLQPKSKKSSDKMAECDA